MSKFIIGTIGIFIVTAAALFMLGLVPDAVRSPSSGLGFVVISEPKKAIPRTETGEMPVRVVIPIISVDTIVSNPQSSDIAVLDNELHKGAVRYPGSGLAGRGHMFIFGHSTSLPVVRNPAYKTFSGLGDVKEGDQIIVYSETKEYIYRVFSVQMTTADNAYVDLTADRDMLTISTCNTFGHKEDRFIVEANLVSSREL